MRITPFLIEDCEGVATLHQKAFFKGWTEKDFLEFLENPLVYGLKIEEKNALLGCILWREIGDEAEILTLVVAPHAQKKGRGSFLLRTLFDILIKKNILKLFLEVAEDNASAISFYIQHNFIVLSTRPHYYERENGKFVTALNLLKKLG